MDQLRLSGLKPGVDLGQLLIPLHSLGIEAGGFFRPLPQPEGHDVKAACQFSDLIAAIHAATLFQISPCDGLRDRAQPQYGPGNMLRQEIPQQNDRQGPQREDQAETGSTGCERRNDIFAGQHCAHITHGSSSHIERAVMNGERPTIELTLERQGLQRIGGANATREREHLVAFLRLDEGRRHHRAVWRQEQDVGQGLQLHIRHKRAEPGAHPKRTNQLAIPCPDRCSGNQVGPLGRFEQAREFVPAGIHLSFQHPFDGVNAGKVRPGIGLDVPALQVKRNRDNLPATQIHGRDGLDPIIGRDSGQGLDQRLALPLLQPLGNALHVRQQPQGL